MRSRDCRMAAGTWSNENVCVCMSFGEKRFCSISEAARRVAFLRHKLTKAMDDPLTRDQIVKAIRSMMTEGK